MEKLENMNLEHIHKVYLEKMDLVKRAFTKKFDKEFLENFKDKEPLEFLKNGKSDNFIKLHYYDFFNEVGFALYNIAGRFESRNDNYTEMYKFLSFVFSNETIEGFYNKFHKRFDNYARKRNCPPSKTLRHELAKGGIVQVLFNFKRDLDLFFKKEPYFLDFEKSFYRYKYIVEDYLKAEPMSFFLHLDKEIKELQEEDSKKQYEYPEFLELIQELKEADTKIIIV